MSGDLMLTLRLATPADIPALRDLIEQSARAVSVGYYTCTQVESALRYVFGPDTQLIADRTYYVIEGPAGELVAAGGWSRRRTLYGGDQMKGAEDPLLDPATDAARIRAFFVHPAWVRRGLGRRLFDQCAADAAGGGFRALELMATLPGEPLYCAVGFVEVERLVTPLPDGEALPVVRMARPLSAPPVAEPDRTTDHGGISRFQGCGSFGRPLPYAPASDSRVSTPGTGGRGRRSRPPGPPPGGTSTRPPIGLAARRTPFRT